MMSKLVTQPMIGYGVKIGDRVNIGPHSEIRNGARIDRDVTLGEHVEIDYDIGIKDHAVLGDYTVIENRVRRSRNKP